MTQEQRIELLTLIVNNETHATVSTQYVDQSNICRHDGLLITECSASLLYAVVAWVGRQRDTREVAGPVPVHASMVDWHSGPGLRSRTRGLLVA